MFDGYFRQKGVSSHLISVSLQSDHINLYRTREWSRNTFLHVKLPLVQYSHGLMIGYLGVVDMMQGLLFINTKNVVHDQGMICTCM